MTTAAAVRQRQRERARRRAESGSESRRPRVNCRFTTQRWFAHEFLLGPRPSGLAIYYISMAPPARCPPCTGPGASGRTGQHTPRCSAAPATAVRPPSPAFNARWNGEWRQPDDANNDGEPTERNAQEYSTHSRPTPATPPPPSKIPSWHSVDRTPLRSFVT
jgi:hypothetical protein